MALSAQSALCIGPIAPIDAIFGPIGPIGAMYSHKIQNYNGIIMRLYHKFAYILNDGEIINFQHLKRGPLVEWLSKYATVFVKCYICLCMYLWPYWPYRRYV